MSDNDPVYVYFEALREEINHLETRILRTLGFGASAIPIVLGFGKNYDSPLLAGGPILAVVFSLILFFEQFSIMRAGKYIRTHLEPHMFTDGTYKGHPAIGWETYLEQQEENRLGEKAFGYAAHILFAFYYIVAAVLAYWTVQSMFSATAAFWISMIYGALFLLYFGFITSRLPTSSQ